MRIMRFVFAAFVLFSIGCKKNADKPNPTLSGKWELAYAVGGWIGSQTYDSGNGNTLVFSDSTFVQTIKAGDSTYQYSGSYSIYTGKYCEQSENQTLIQLGNSFLPMVFSLSGSTFTIATPNCIFDGATYTYRKIFF